MKTIKSSVIATSWRTNADAEDAMGWLTHTHTALQNTTKKRQTKAQKAEDFLE